MKHTVVIKEEPQKLIISNKFGEFYSDGAIGGNGDVGVVFGGTTSNLTLFLTKADFWKGIDKKEHGGIRPIAKVDIRLIHKEPCEYYVEERMEEGQIFAEMGKYKITITPCATENTVLLQFEYPKTSMQPNVVMSAIDTDESINLKGKDGEVEWASRTFGGDEFLFETSAIVTKRKFPISIENMVVNQTYAFGITTNHDTAAYKTYGMRRSAMMVENDCKNLLSAHMDYWRDFWSKSSVKISDDQLELNWYWGIYVMACCARNKQFPPGIFGNFVTSDDVPWSGDYHLNYNYQAPFYPLMTANHVELTDCYEAGYKYFIPEGRRFAREVLNCRGVYFPVGIGALGHNASQFSASIEFGQNFLGQKSNAVHLTTIIAMRWYSTLDMEFARSVYPYMLDVADFWEDYLRFEDGRYFIDNDTAHEIECWRPDYDPIKHKCFADDMNPLLTLGLLRMFFRCLLDMSEKLDNEYKDNEKWMHILEHLSPYPTFEKDGKKVFRYTEKGMDWHKGGSLCLQQVYPANAVDLADEELYQITRDTFLVSNRWVDNNAFSSYYPCATRIGIEPEEIIRHMKEQCKDYQFPCMMYYIFGGSLENTSAGTNTLNEMMLQSYDGIVRIFPCFPKTIDCSFEKLRAYGAFVVSAEQKDGKISGIRIVSEKGEDLKLKNPYGTSKVVVDGAETVINDEIIVVKTKKDSLIEVFPV